VITWTIVKFYCVACCLLSVNVHRGQNTRPTRAMAIRSDVNLSRRRRQITDSVAWFIIVSFKRHVSLCIQTPNKWMNAASHLKAKNLHELHVYTARGRCSSTIEELTAAPQNEKWPTVTCSVGVSRQSVILFQCMRHLRSITTPSRSTRDATLFKAQLHPSSGITFKDAAALVTSLLRPDAAVGYCRSYCTIIVSIIIQIFTVHCWSRCRCCWKAVTFPLARITFTVSNTASIPLVAIR